MVPAHGRNLNRGARLVAAQLDDELVILDAAACQAAAAPVVLSRKPGGLYVKGEGDCDDCVEPPDRCLVLRPDDGDVDYAAPAWLPDGTAVVVADNALCAYRNATRLWKAELSLDGHAVAGPDGTLYVLGVTGDEPSALRLLAIDPKDGHARWQRRLGIAVPEAIVSPDDFHLVLDGEWIVAGYKQELAAVALAPR